MALTVAISHPLRAAAPPFDLPQLMALMARQRSGEARFSEDRFVAGFDQPLHSSGRLRYQAPDRFERHTELPRPESMVVQGDQLVLERSGRRRTLALDAVPELAAIVAALRGTLIGDARGLQTYFDTRVGGDARLWSLTLTPRDDRLAALVRQLRIDGQQTALRSVEMLMTDGDRSLMQIGLPQALAADGAASASASASTSAPGRPRP